MSKTYSGMGSRETPHNTLITMHGIARFLAKNYTLRTGNADGADYAFMLGCALVDGRAEVFNPWETYNTRQDNIVNRLRGTYYNCPSRAAIELAAKYHPAWDKCTQGARKLHGRNMHIILGYDLKSPVNFVICWHNGSGGTMQGVRCALDHDIPVYNLKDMTLEQVMEKINEYS